MPHSSIRIGLSSPRTISLLSYGEVSSPETFNIRSREPIKKGLFCETIFGPIKRGRCSCGSDNAASASVCGDCGKALLEPGERRRRHGHITLAAPVVHVWFYKGRKSIIAKLIGLPARHVQKIVCYELYVVTEPGGSGLKRKQVLSHEEYIRSRVLHNDFHAATGAEAIRTLLRGIGPDIIAQELREYKRQSKKGRNRFVLVDKFLKSSNAPESVIIDVLPVLPPGLRPILFLENGAIVASDLNLLYSRVIHKNQSLRRLINFGAPDIILQNAKRLLQAAVDSLLDNRMTDAAQSRSQKRALKSISDGISAKKGRFRSNLLAKRVDYSGRAQITIGPELKVHQVGIPKTMALELFRPFIYGWLIKNGFAPCLRQAKAIFEKEKPEVWDALEETTAEHPVILNRAPTLHKLSMQAFDVVLIDGAAIRLHPLVCSGFNADFDGDTVAVHVPLSFEAQLEARILMMSVNNLFHPASGRIALSPSQDIVLGIYYLTLELHGRKGEGMFFSDVEEVYAAYSNNVVEVHSRIYVRIAGSLVSTTTGRAIFSMIVPAGIPFQAVNKLMKKKDIAGLLELCYEKCGSRNTIRFLDELKALGFKFATKSGISLGLDDMKVSTRNSSILENARQAAADVRLNHERGLMSDSERYSREIEIWTSATERITAEALTALSADGQEAFNSLFVMADSGARGDVSQIRQITGMRGLMAKPTGEIVEVPITSNFKEGLSTFEFFLSTHGARKGRVDGPLKTPVAGYFTRKLVSAARDVVVTMDDCRTLDGIYIEPLKSDFSIEIDLAERITGRVLADNVIHPRTRTIVASYGAFVDKEAAATIVNAGIERLKVRSVMTCKAPQGVCAKCYGLNIGSRTEAETGDAVGIIAAQSIGEPGTQLTLRTFHAGGTAVFRKGTSVASSGKAIKTMDITGGLPEVIDLLEARTPNLGGLLQNNGVDAVRRLITDGAQKIYRRQGVSINDKHFEIILMQMTGFVKISEPGDALFQCGDIVRKRRFENECLRMRNKGLNVPAATPVLLGISQIPMHSDSFLEAASFQKTTSVLADAAFEGKIDDLESNASRVIMGKLVRVGTGLVSAFMVHDK